MIRLWDLIRNWIYTAIYWPRFKTKVIKLAKNLSCIQEERIPLQFVIKSLKDSGFMVKVGPMNAYLPYTYMPWQYKTKESWQAVSKYLLGKRFFGTVHYFSFNELVPKIKLNAQSHYFRSKDLIVGKEYQTVIVHKSVYGLFIDLGYHFNWEYGSFTGLLHISTFENPLEFEDAQPGQVIKTHFHGYSNEGRLLLGNKDYQREWRTGELEGLIGTAQKVTVKINSDGKKEYFVMDKYRTVLPITKAYYHRESIKILKGFKDQLKDQDNFECKIIKIRRYDHFVGVMEVEGEDRNFCNDDRNNGLSVN